ncbi:glycosyltransferase [Arenicella sp.]|nr:glycosyltransferase [Arenicella sp.]
MNSFPFKLIELNPALDASDGFYSLLQEQKEAKFTFSPADDQHVAEQLSGLQDLGSFSAEIEKLAGSGAYISPLRSQNLSAFNFSEVQTALEISNDHGNLCRFLAEHTNVIESIKFSPNAARSTAYRCADLANVSVVNVELALIDIPQKHYDLIVIADIETIADDAEMIEQLLSRAEQALSKTGILVLITQNPQPVSAWFKQDQAIPYAGLYSTSSNLLPQQEWSGLLDKVGLTCKNEYCVLPNSQHPRTILSKQYLNSNPDAINHFYAAGLVGAEKVNEYLLFSQLSKSQDLYELCDSYLTIGAKSSDALSSFYACDFTHFSSPGRRRRWRTITNKSTAEGGVNKSLLFPAECVNQADQKQQSDGISISQNLGAQDFKTGQLLVGLWLQSLVHEEVAEGKFAQYVKDYDTWLQANVADLGGQLYDILPFNLIVSEQDDYQVIDAEWTVDQIVTADFVLFRALFWFGFQNRDLLHPLATANGLFSLSDFVDYGFKLVGRDVDIKAFSHLETTIQSRISKQFNQDVIDETLRLPITGTIPLDADLPQPKAQVFFYNSDSDAEFEFTNSAVLVTKNSSSAEKLSFSLSKIDLNRNTLRIDPVDRGGFFRISDLLIRDKNDVALWSLKSAKEIADSATLNNAIFADSHLGNLFIGLTDDPQLIFDLSYLSNLADATRLDLTLTYYQGIDYRLAMQEFSHTVHNSKIQQQYISSQRNQLETVKARYNELREDFVFLKNNSEKQNDYIERLKKERNEIKNEYSNKIITEKEKSHKYVLQQQTLIQDQSDIIGKQFEMMTRTFSTRVKLFIARLLNKPSAIHEDSLSDSEQVVEVASNKKLLDVSDVGQNNDDYALWIKKHRLNSIEIDRIKIEIEALSIKPVFSIVVPVYNIEEKYLMLAVDSVRNQLYPFWELCLIDDASPAEHIRPLLKRLAALDDRILIKLNKQNQGIAGASNDGLAIATGDFVCLLDHDDEISPDALYENAKVINEYPNVGFIYSDEDKMTMQEQRVDPFFKPDYSPELLESQNYICHFSVMSREVIEQIRGFRLGYDGSQDHDIIMRAIQHAERVVHIPKVLYHWRKVPGSTADIYDAKSYAWEAGRKAVASKFAQSGEAGEVVLGSLQGTYRIKREVIGAPKVSIIIPFKDRADLLETCLNSIITESTYQNYEIIGVSNASEEDVTYDLMKEFDAKYPKVRFVEKNVPFNFSLLCNFGVSESSGDYVLLLNNDIEIQTADWIELLLEHAQRPEIGAVGGKLLFPDGRIQHAGVVAGLYGAAGHTHLYFSGDNIGYYGGLMVTRNVSAVTGAMLMVSRKKFDQVEGLDEANLAVAYNDVDFCLKLLMQGYRNVFTPYCHAVHHESASRGYEDNPEKVARLEKEKHYFVTQWRDFLDRGDPYFNPNFDHEQFDFSIKL